MPDLQEVDPRQQPAIGEHRLDRDLGRRQEPRGLARDSADAARMRDDPNGEVEGGKQQLGLGGGGYGHAAMLTVGAAADIGAATTERHGSVDSRLRTW